MSDLSPSRVRGGILVSAVVLVGAGAFYIAVKHKDGSSLVPRANAAPLGFEDRAREAGLNFRMKFLPSEQGEKFKINLYDHGCGVAVGDYDGDGRDDIYFCNQLGENALYHNNGDGTFTDVTREAGVGLGDRISVAATWADYDNSGRQSLFVTSTRGGNVLFKNLGNGKFQDVTREAGLTHIGHSQTAVFFDYDNDGYLDLLVTNTARWTQGLDKQRNYYPGGSTLPDLASSPKEYNVLYHNNHNGTFTDVTEKAGLKGKGWSGDAAVFDYNDDGYLDIFITNMFGASQLYRNNRDGTFTEVTPQVLGKTSWGAIGSKAFDFNNDGRLDLLIVDMHSDMWMEGANTPEWEERLRNSAKKKYRYFTGPLMEIDQGTAQRIEQGISELFHIHYQDVIFGNTLFQNLGEGKFEEMSDRAGLETLWPWGIATGDFDNNGYEDVYLPSGMGYPYCYWPSSLMMNNGDGTFTDQASAQGIEPPRDGIYLPEKIGGQPAARSSRCAATADFEGDGRLEIVTNNFNDAPYYYKNNFPRKNYIAFRFQGTRSNRDAIGALVRLYAGDQVMVRQVQAAGGYLSQSSKTVHFGLGDRTHVDRVEIRWPSGKRQTIPDPEPNQLHEVVEQGD
jgi:enediyne biosynthesis protein E4